MANIKARKRLSDLFKKGVEIRFGTDPDSGEPRGWIGPFKDSAGGRQPCPDDQVAMFIRPADPLQREMAMREANAKRARALVKSKRDEDSEEHLTIMAFLADMEDETLIDYVLVSDAGARRTEAEREVLASPDWKDMDAYQDAMRQFEEMSPEDLEGNEEWEALLELDQKFGQQVTKREEELIQAQREVLRMQLSAGRSQVEKKALEKRAEMVGTQAFMQEYELQMLYFSVREVENTDQMFFDSPRELAAQPEQVREIINEALLPFISDGNEAKNLPRAESGSQQSDLPKKPETSESSTPEEQIA